MTEEMFRYQVPNFSKLQDFGFSEEGGEYVYHTEIFEGQFMLTVRISKDGSLKTELLDSLTGEPYSLHLVADAVGEFVGRVRTEYEKTLNEIAARCFDREVFRCGLTKQLIVHVREKYGDEPEYLWQKFPDNAIWRRKDNRKWYGLILTVAREKLGMAGEGGVEILDVRADPTQIPLIADGKRIFGGYHMNKKHWIAMPLDGSIPLEELKIFLEESFEIAGER